LQLLYASIIVYNFALLVVKDSLLYQYLRFFVHRKYRIIAWCMMAFIMVGGIALILISCFSCHPVAYFWDKTVDGSCITRQPLWYTMAGFQLSTDFATLALPIPVLLALQLPKKQKISLVLVFMLGGL
jgi:hypothetical protein